MDKMNKILNHGETDYNDPEFEDDGGGDDNDDDWWD